MSGGLKRMLAPGALALAVLLAAPLAADASIAFVRGFAKPAVWAAQDNGSGQRRLSLGFSPHVSPDGTTVAFMSFASSPTAPPRLMLVPTSGGAPRTLASGWRDPESFAWSPNSGTVAAVLGPEIGKDRLVLIDVEDGSQQTLASGYFSGVSFSPNGESLAYAMARNERQQQRSNIYRVALTGGSPVAITHDDRSLWPLWGPSGKIVFVKLLDAKRRLYGPKNELFTMSPSGGQVHQLTHTVVGPLVQGLVPTQWSASGSRLLCEFGGQDTSYAVTVNPKTGAEHTVGGTGGFVASALSASGSTIFGFTGFLGPGPHNIATVGYRGGPVKTLIRNGIEPSVGG
jgi:Tol biopolymer transport system component